MRWKQFFTPVKSLDADEAKKYISLHDAGTYTILDVRQPSEYETDHIPGAKLIPLGDLNNRITELDAHKPTIVYCAIGGRSRVAAQMIAGKDFKEVYNLTGGIKAWHSEKAFGPESLGMNLFSGKESTEETLRIGYSLEGGLRDFYLSMVPQINNEKTRHLFEKLAAIEVLHQDRLFDEYVRISNQSIGRDEFEENNVSSSMEGGLTTEEYMELYQPDLEIPEEVISLAMAIEAQALDLYQRAADRAVSQESKNALTQIAAEEHTHLEQLGKLFEQL